MLHIDPSNHATATFSNKFKTQGPFKNRNWDKKVKVPVTTLDELISEYGIPVFCKIDVEGYEVSVLKGLSVPIPYISFEYSKNLLKEVESCLSHLNKLGNARFNFSVSYNSTKLKLRKWTKSKKKLIDEVQKVPLGYPGDVFVNFLN